MLTEDVDQRISTFIHRLVSGLA